MASVVASSAVVAPSAFAAATPSSAVESSSSQTFVGLKSAAGVFASKSASLSSKAVSNGSRVQCMQVWTPISNLKFETLSYLPPLSPRQISKEIDYMLENKWIPCLEFDSVGVIYRKYHKSPGYYDGRYWTMWKLPMFGCTDSGPVLREIELVKKEYPNCYIRVLGFDNVRQVQCSAFIVHKPATPRLPQLGLQARPGQRLPGLPSISPSYSSRPAQPLRTPSRPQQEAPQRETNSSFSSSEFRPPTSALPTDPLDWEALSVVGKFAEKLVDQPVTSQARKLREQRWQRLQQAASELSGLTGAIASNSAAHDLYIQEIEDTIDLLRRASTQQNANLQSAVGRFVASYYRNK